jgi:hypothetical protein
VYVTERVARFGAHPEPEEVRELHLAPGIQATNRRTLSSPRVRPSS